MGTAERRERERSQMQEAIIDAALEVFLTEGYEQTSIRRIAEKIEYTPGAIYSYFKDKDAILYEIHVRGFARLFEYLSKAVNDADPLDRLYQIGQWYIRFAMENRQYYDLMFISRSIPRSFEDHMEKDAKEWESGAHAYGLLRQVIAECIEKKLLPPGDIDAASYSFWSMVHGMIALVLRKRCMICPDIQHETLLRDSYDFMWTTIREKR